MYFKVTGKCFIKQESGLFIDEAGNMLPAQFVMFCRITPFVITEEGDINNFTGGKMESIYQVDNQFFEFFKGQVKDLQAERSQSIIVSVFRALIGSRDKTRRRQVTGITSTPVMAGLTTSATKADTQTTAAEAETTLEPQMPVLVAEVPVHLPMVDSQLGGSYITNAQIHNDGSNVSICSLDSEAQDNLKCILMKG